MRDFYHGAMVTFTIPDWKRDLRGQKFGEWTVLSMHKYKSHKGYDLYLCKCSCAKGTTKLLASYELTKGKTSGCKRCSLAGKRKRQPRKTYGTAKREAASRGMAFTISEHDYADLGVSPCYLHGYLPEADGMLHGIDRIDSDKGYEPGNVASCCWHCNRMKGMMSLPDFLDHIRKIYDFNMAYPARLVA